MSAEGKKKRGVSGATNAKAIPFRYHGYPKGYSLSTALGRSDRFAGAKFLNAMTLGVHLPGFTATDRMYRTADEAMERKEARGRKVSLAFADAA